MKKTFTGWMAKGLFEDIGYIDGFDSEYDFSNIYAKRGNKKDWANHKRDWPPIKVEVTVETVE